MVYIACIVLAMLLAVAALQIGRIVAAYRVATGTPWQRFLAAFSHSQTVLLARLGAFASAILVFGIDFLPDMDPTNPIGEKISALIPPQYAPYYFLVFSLLVEVVRKRPGSLDPITPPPLPVVIPPAPPVDVIDIPPATPPAAPLVALPGA